MFLCAWFGLCHNWATAKGTNQTTHKEITVDLYVRRNSPDCCKNALNTLLKYCSFLTQINTTNFYQPNYPKMKPEARDNSQLGKTKRTEIRQYQFAKIKNNRWYNTKQKRTLKNWNPLTKTEYTFSPKGLWKLAAPKSAPTYLKKYNIRLTWKNKLRLQTKPPL